MRTCRTDGGTTDGRDCRMCGESLADTPDQRVLTAVEDGTVVHRYFCSDDCLERWSA
ncbi:DUF7576 family protein [Natronosalvus rutilus]|uniref:Uncharacterized protein n=1 Tax=Natronosalvus rutilus TaxID=2953753 RepID=A0A9E7NAG2_9EURY|nr:hypothetical protein [Natronosalvus rutilus]UTF53841.1 hypothetical protein NGM29_00720 [Natronosalvus rutilus]